MHDLPSPRVSPPRAADITPRRIDFLWSGRLARCKHTACGRAWRWQEPAFHLCGAMTLVAASVASPIEPPAPAGCTRSSTTAVAGWRAATGPASASSPATATTGRRATRSSPRRRACSRCASCLIDGEALACDEDGLAMFERLRQKPAGRHVFRYAFELLALGGQAHLPCVEDKARRRCPPSGRKTRFFQIPGIAAGLHRIQHRSLCKELQSLQQNRSEQDRRRAQRGCADSGFTEGSGGQAAHNSSEVVPHLWVLVVSTAKVSSGPPPGAKPISRFRSK
jgi:hypothetical protein